MSATLDLINAIQSGDSIEIENNFNAIMAAKVSDKLDALRTEVSKNMFNDAQEESEQLEPEDGEVTEE